MTASTFDLLPIGGTGIGPLAGFVRSNSGQRPIRLFLGMRHPSSDFLYGKEMPAWQDEGRLARLIRDGARVMVCGGRDMAAGVAEALAEILAPTGLSPSVPKAAGRYVKGVY